MTKPILGRRWVVLWLWAWLVGIGWGQTPTPAPAVTSAPTTSVDLDTNRLHRRHDELAQQLAALQRQPETPVSLEQRRLLKMQLSLVENELSEVDAFQQAREQYTLPVVGDQAPYSLELADELRQQRERILERIQELGRARSATRDSLHDAERTLQQVRSDASDPLTELRREILQEETRRQKLVLSLQGKEQLLAADTLKSVGKLLSRVDDGLQFPRSELESRKREIARERDKVNQQLARLGERSDPALRQSLESQLDALETQSHLWDLRFQLHQGQADSQNFTEVSLIRQALQRQLALLEPRLDDEETPRTLQEQLNIERETLEKTVQLTDLLMDEQKSELGARLTWSVGWRRAVAVFSGIWNFEILRVGDQVLTVKKVVLALALLLFGINLSRRAIRQLHARALVPMGIPAPRAAVLEKVSYYVLVSLVILTALHIVNIPLTFFTFLGGSVAIAAGFGAQTLFNNFISGLILTFEQPIRVGDLIEIDGTYAVVLDIGARCTHIQTSAGVHILVPNSKLLENNLINWTLGDSTVRTSMKLTVPYGSDAELVQRLIFEVLQAHPGIQKARGLKILLTNFADKGLEFEILFWLKVRRMMDRRTLESDVRLAIYGVFREHGIDFPLPQRDLHLRPEEPLSVRIESPPS